MKKRICGSPLLHPPDARAPHPGKGLRPLHSYLLIFLLKEDSVVDPGVEHGAEDAYYC
jgi:hypothetical protein